MAYLEKTPRKGGYVIRIKQYGLDTSVQTRTLKLSKAKRELKRINGRIEAVRENKLIFPDEEGLSKKQAKKQRLEMLRYGRLLVLKHEETDSKVTLGDAVDSYLKAKNRKLAFNTVVGYKGNLKPATEFFGKEKVVADLTKPDVQAFVDSQESKVAIKTVKARLSQLRVLLTWLESDELIPAGKSKIADQTHLDFSKEKPEEKWQVWASLAKRIALLKKLGKPLDDKTFFVNVHLDEVELSRLFAMAHEKFWTNGTHELRRLFAALCFAAHTATRRSEIARVQRSDIDLDSEAPTVTVGLMKGRGNYTIVRHTVPLHPNLVAVLEEWLDELPKSRRMVFAANEDVLRSDGSLNEKANRKAADNLGQHLWRNLANTEFALVSGWHIHRHSLLTLLGTKGHTVEEAMAFVNHRTQKVAEMYRHVEQKQNPELLHGLDFTPNGVEGGVNYPVVKKEMAQKGRKPLLSQGVSNRVRTGDLRNHNPEAVDLLCLPKTVIETETTAIYETFVIDPSSPVERPAQ